MSIYHDILRLKRLTKFSAIFITQKAKAALGGRQTNSLGDELEIEADEM